MMYQYHNQLIVQPFHTATMRLFNVLNYYFF